MKTFLIVLVAVVFYSSGAYAQEECPKDKVCLTRAELEQIKKAVRELKDIHDSKAELKLEEPIIIIRDWEDRVYINGGEQKPIKIKLKIGKHVDRDMEMTLPIEVHYREKPPDPWLRLRIRAQVGVFVPEMFTSIGDNNAESFFDGGIGWDFINIAPLHMNISAYTGVRSLGGGPGFDITKNFGLYGGYALVYDGLTSSANLMIYFSFN